MDSIPANQYPNGANMRDRRKRQTLNVGEGLFPDRRVHLLGRRRHQGFTRILFPFRPLEPFKVKGSRKK